MKSFHLLYLTGITRILYVTLLLILPFFSNQITFAQSFCGYDYDYTGDTLRLVGQKYTNKGYYLHNNKGKTDQLYKSFNENKMRLNHLILMDDTPNYVGDYIVTNSFIDEYIALSKYYSSQGTVLELTNINNGTIVYYFMSKNMNPIKFPFEYRGICPEYNYYQTKIIQEYDKFENVTMRYIRYELEYRNFEVLISNIEKDSTIAYSFTIICKSDEPMRTNGLYIMFEDGSKLGNREIYIETTYSSYSSAYNYINRGTIIVAEDDFLKLSNIKMTDIRIGNKDYSLGGHESEEIMGYINALIDKK